jgi:hypothetical protein
MSELICRVTVAAVSKSFHLDALVETIERASERLANTASRE